MYDDKDIINEGKVDVFDSIVMALSGAIFVTCIGLTALSIKERIKLKKAIKNYENQNNDLVKYKEFDYKFYKLKKKWYQDFTSRDFKDKGKEDSDKAVFDKLRKFLNKRKDIKLNRIVEYSLDNKPCISIIYTEDGYYNGQAYYSHRKIGFRFFNNSNINKHELYYILKGSMDRGMYPMSYKNEIKEFVKKYNGTSIDDNE